MNDAEFRELVRRIVIMDYKLAFVVELLNKILPEMKHDGEAVTLKQLLDARLAGFVGPLQNAVTDQVLAEMRETAAHYRKTQSDSE